MTAPRRGTALRRFGPYVAAVAIAVAAVAGLMWRPTPIAPTHRADYVVLAGAAGLRWDDIDPVGTPTLWELASNHAIAALSVRSAHRPTCPADGWLTLGAGNFALWDTAAAEDRCPPVNPRLTSPDGIGAKLVDLTTVNGHNRDLYGAQPGALAEAVRCTAAVGPGAAVAAARPFGRVDRYAATLPTDPADLAVLLSRCTLSIVDLGTVDGVDPSTRRVQAQAVDAHLARVIAARPPNSLLLVAGLSDTDTTSHLHVAIADGPGYDAGWLTSYGTGRDGYIRLVDLAPTALAALGKPDPVKLFAGYPARPATGRPADPKVAIARLADADHESAVQHNVAVWFFWALVLIEVGLLIACIPMLRRARRSAEPHGPPPVSPRVVRRIEALLVCCALLIAAALLTGMVPWWRAGATGLVFAAVGLGFAGALTAVVVWGPWWGGTLGPVAAASGLCAAVVGIDVLTGSRLQLNGVAGYSATAGSRWAGVGPVGLGVFVVGTLLFAGCVAQSVRLRVWRPAVVAAIGALGVVVAGSPYLGSDPGGAVALTAGACIAAAIASGGWLSAARFTWALFAGLAVLIGFAVLDLRRPVGQRGPVGAFLTQIHGGTAGIAIHRTAVNDVLATFANPLSLLVGVAVVFNLAVLIRPWGGLLRLFGLYPPVRGAMTGIAVAAVLGGLLDGDGFLTAGAAAAVALPLVTLGALRVLDHADDRTVSRTVTVEAEAGPVAVPAKPHAAATAPGAAPDPGGAPATAGT